MHDANASTTVYYGIPYAHAARFKPAVPIGSESRLCSVDIVDASAHGPACIQFNLPPPYDKGFALLTGTTPVQPQAEDCLTMDVYVPDGGYQDLPVLFYTPGGGFLVGASFTYDFRSLINLSIGMGKPFIAVVINYRLGPLGTLNPSIWGEDVNLSILDQVEALRYVQEHIHAFGGDPRKVTIGERMAV